ncbi:MAG: HAD-IA family hydrolase [Terriglobales bacterium]
MFDLDGTLIDSRADLAGSVNATLEHLGREPMPLEQVAAYVGDGAALLVERALGLQPAPDRRLWTPERRALNPSERALAEAGLEFFLSYYRQHQLDCTTLYPGVGAGVEQLAAAGYQLAVLSNKPVGPSRAIVAGLGLAPFFGAVLGGDSFMQKKPDPVGVRALVAEAGVAPRQAVMIGDSIVDVQAGRQAGAYACGAAWGFAPQGFALEPPDWIAPSFEVLTGQLLTANG